MGNTVILKPATQTPIFGGVIFALWFELAGLPEGLFHVLPGAGAETGTVKEPLVNMLSSRDRPAPAVKLIRLRADR